MKSTESCTGQESLDSIEYTRFKVLGAYLFQLMGQIVHIENLVCMDRIYV